MNDLSDDDAQEEEDDDDESAKNSVGVLALDGKNDSFIQSLRSTRFHENSSLLDSNSISVEGTALCSKNSSLSPKPCPICCEDHKDGDEIAWSKNENCVHVYHLDCIVDWLVLDNDDCPNCRQNYIEDT